MLAIAAIKRRLKRQRAGQHVILRIFAMCAGIAAAGIQVLCRLRGPLP
jgi:hypothetical protein